MYNDVRNNESRGFSLVELIVVIAIMAVMTAVLAPSLLQYVERSRAQKDDSAMGEVVQVIALALAEQDVYDECLCYTIENNASAYIEGEDETPWNLTAIPGDTAIRGLTITFRAGPTANESVLDLGDGFVNELLNGTGFNGKENPKGRLKEMCSGTDDTSTFKDNILYTKVLAGIPGGKVTLTSQTFRNSDYTVFIQMGSSSDAVSVSGGWNGTNLHKDHGVSEVVTN